MFVLGWLLWKITYTKAIKVNYPFGPLSSHWQKRTRKKGSTFFLSLRLTDSEQVHNFWIAKKPNDSHTELPSMTLNDSRNPFPIKITPREKPANRKWKSHYNQFATHQPTQRATSAKSHVKTRHNNFSDQLFSFSCAWLCLARFNFRARSRRRIKISFSFPARVAALSNRRGFSFPDHNRIQLYFHHLFISVACYLVASRISN